ncbi:MAG: hypothetical protein GX079_01990 [Tissierellia bacterium]|nr:hypothetical protein [Tissierellia bacterium]
MVEKVEWTSKGVKIRLDGEEYLIHTKAFLEFSPGEGEEVDLDALLYRSCYYSALERTENYLSRGLRTKKQLRDYLEKRNFSKCAEEVLEFLEEMGLINDLHYGRSYYEEERHKRGSYAIAERLKNRGLTSSVIAQIYMEEDPEDAARLLLKKYSFWDELDYKEEVKRKNFLLGRGFSYETINKAMILAKNTK